MKNAFIIHGAYGSPEENWLPWLKAELEEQGYKVTVPRFPTPEEQNYGNWIEVIEPYLSEFNEKTILIGHSIGATFTLCILEKLQVQIAKTALAAGFVSNLGENVSDELAAMNVTIAERKFDWEKIRQNSKNFYIFQSDNDKYVSIEKGIELGNFLQVDPIIIPNGAHFNQGAGFVKFPQLLDIILDR